MIKALNIKHKWKTCIWRNTLFVKTDTGEEVEIYTTFDLLELIKTTKFDSDVYHEYNEILLNYLEYDEDNNIVINDLYNKYNEINCELYNIYLKNQIDKLSQGKYFEKKIIKNRLWHG